MKAASGSPEARRPPPVCHHTMCTSGVHRAATTPHREPRWSGSTCPPAPRRRTCTPRASSGLPGMSRPCLSRQGRRGHRMPADKPAGAATPAPCRTHIRPPLSSTHHMNVSRHSNLCSEMYNVWPLPQRAQRVRKRLLPQAVISTCPGALS